MAKLPDAISFNSLMHLVRKVGSPHVHYLWNQDERTLCGVHQANEVERLLPDSMQVDCKACIERRISLKRSRIEAGSAPASVLAAHYRQQDADLADEELRREHDDGIARRPVPPVRTAGTTVHTTFNELMRAERIEISKHIENTGKRMTRLLSAEAHAFTMAQLLGSEKDFSKPAISYGKWVNRCRHCEAIKDEQAIIQWTHGDGCPVNLALQVIENYTNKEKDV